MNALAPGRRYKKPPLLEYYPVDGEQSLGVISWQDFIAPAIDIADPGFLIRVWHGLLRINKDCVADLHHRNVQQLGPQRLGAGEPVSQPEEITRPFMALPYMARRTEHIGSEEAIINLDGLYALTKAQKLDTARDVGIKSVGLVIELLNTQISSRDQHDAQPSI